MSIRGDFGKLDQLVRALERLGDDATLSGLSKNLAEEAISLVQEGFRSQSDPYGKAWARKRNPDGRAILVGQTARLRRSWHRVAYGARGFKIISAVQYASYQQTGTRPHVIRARNGRALVWKSGGRTRFARSVHHPGSVARKMVPDAGRLPPKWRDAFRETAHEYLMSIFAGRKVK